MGFKQGRKRSVESTCAQFDTLVALVHYMEDCKYILQVRKPWAVLEPCRALPHTNTNYMYVCMYVCIERESEREQVRTVFVPVNRIQELIQVAENSEINETTALLSNPMQLSRERIAQCDVFLLPNLCALMNEPGPNLNFANVRGAVEPSPVADLLE